MASETIKGITIEIGADSKKFTTALKEIDKDARDISKDLKTVGENLKLDPSNVGKSADKLKLLQDAAANASKKVDLIKQAIQKLNEQSADKSTEKYKNALADLERQLESAQREQDLANQKVKAFGEESEEAGEKALSLGDVIKGNVIASVITGGLKKVGDLFATLAKKAWEAAKAVAAFAKEYALEAVGLAAAYEDAVGYSEQVYGDLAEESQKWAAENSVRLRVYKGDLQDYANSFGAIFAGFGFGTKEALEMSETLISLAADLRSATGKDIGEVISSLTSGFTSSTKSLQQFGVVTNEAAIKAKALEMGLVNVAVDQTKVQQATLKVTEANKKASEALKKYGENSLEYQKAQLNVTKAEEEFNKALGGTAVELDRTQRTSALLAIVMEDLNFLLGQSDKEAGNYNSQLDITKTILKNLQEEIGEKLLPVFTEFVKKFNEFLQSAEGQTIMDKLVEGVSTLADKVLEFVTSGKLEEWIAKLKEDMPGIIQDVKDFAGVVGDCVQPILDLYRAVKNHRDLKELDEAIRSSKTEVHAFAQSCDIDMNTLRTAINGFAQLNNVSLTEIYGDWAKYQPQIAEYMASTGTISEEMKTKVTTSTNTMAETVQGDMQTVGESFQAGINAAGSANTSGLAAKTAEIESFGDRVKRALANFIDNSGWFANAPGAEYAHRAGGGRAFANVPYVVGDDAQRRPEIFVPDTNGTIMNGSQTERVLNNINNSRSVGDVNIYLNSYGTDATSIVNEIGIAVQQKLRMSGAMLY